MKVITASDLRANLADVFDAIENDAEDVVVTRSGHEPMVIMWIPTASWKFCRVATTTRIGSGRQTHLVEA